MLTDTNQLKQSTGSDKLPVSLTPAQIGLTQEISSKKRTLHNLADLLMTSISDAEIEQLDENFDELDIFEALFEREQLGSTAVGSGCAVPHGRIMGINNPKVAILTLTSPLEFDSPDEQGVDILVGLLVPDVKKNNEKHNAVHLELLAAIATILNDKQNQDFLRSATASKSVCSFFIESLQNIFPLS
jgi:PTS system nitrogen regulatory IIA component